MAVGVNGHPFRLNVLNDFRIEAADSRTIGVAITKPST